MPKSVVSARTIGVGFGKSYDGVFAPRRIPSTPQKTPAAIAKIVPISSALFAVLIDVSADQSSGPCSWCSGASSKLGISSRSSVGTSP